MLHIAIIGFGEAGQIYAQDLARTASVRVWDKKFLTPEAEALRARAHDLRVDAAGTLEDVLANAQLVFSLVTAGNALEVATQAGALLQHGQTFLDFNSVAPETKRAAAKVIDAGAGDYLDVAVMAPVPPKQLATPLLLAGMAASGVAKTLNNLGCNARAVSDRVGYVSAIKMCRSVMINGLEALTTECLSAAQAYGVEQDVLASLHASFPSLGWDAELPHYLISRVVEHGVRRAEEMGEVIKTLQDVGVIASMSAGTQQVQAAIPAKMIERGLTYRELEPFAWPNAMEKLR